MKCYPTWAEIDLQAITHNLREVSRIIPAKTQIMAVVKANGYGHGAVPSAEAALRGGAQILAVARMHEGVELRDAGIKEPILVFGYTSSQDIQELLHYNLIQTVYSLDMAQSLSSAASSLGKKLEVHIKIDTGMGRLGFVPHNLLYNTNSGQKSNNGALREVLAVNRLSGLQVTGLYTHFACADSRDKTSASSQLRIFKQFVAELNKQGLNQLQLHAANSAAIIDIPEAHLDMVRPGIMLYGLYPSRDVNTNRVDLKPALALKARVAMVKEVAPGFKVSYGSTFITTRQTKIAAVAIGYADGYSRLLSSKGVMLVQGVRAPVVGRVCMDQTMLDVGHIPGVESGDEVVVIGRQGEECISADELADAAQTINYEIVSALTSRVQRSYLQSA
jgi:alanine racemase